MSAHWDEKGYWVKLVTSETGASCLHQSHKGVPVVITPFFDHEFYDDFVERNAALLDELLESVPRYEYIDYIEISVAQAYLHMRRETGSVAPRRHTKVFEARWIEPERIQHEGSHRD